jgi:hypothetical protein
VSLDLTLDLQAMLGRGQKLVTIWSRTLQELGHTSAADHVTLHLDIPAEDFVALHIA